MENTHPKPKLLTKSKSLSDSICCKNIYGGGERFIDRNRSLEHLYFSVVKVLTKYNMPCYPEIYPVDRSTRPISMYSRIYVSLKRPTAVFPFGLFYLPTLLKLFEKDRNSIFPVYLSLNPLEILFSLDSNCGRSFTLGVYMLVFLNSRSLVDFLKSFSKEDSKDSLLELYRLRNLKPEHYRFLLLNRLRRT